MIRALLRRVFYAASPRFLTNAYLAMRLRRRARTLVRRADGLSRPAALCDLLWQFPEFLPLQKVSEISRLLTEVGTEPPRTVVEIGTAAGGTAFLFSRIAAPDATLILVDLAFDAGRRAALESLARDRQRVVCLAGDSHLPEFAAQVQHATGKQPVDLLFIDGDHSYQGVAADFQVYSRLVRPGGTVAFHDIVPDAAIRSGVRAQSGADAGGVPQFWSEVKSRFNAYDIIENPEQDGCGIGVIRWQG